MSLSVREALLWICIMVCVLIGHFTLTPFLLSLDIIPFFWIRIVVFLISIAVGYVLGFVVVAIYDRFRRVLGPPKASDFRQDWDDDENDRPIRRLPPAQDGSFRRRDE